MKYFEPDISESYLGELTLIKLLNAGVAETIDIPIPRAARNVVYGYVVLLNNAQVNKADFYYKDRTTDGTIDMISTTNLFNVLPVAAAVTHSALNTQAATHIRWAIQANAGAQTRFFLHIKFFST